MCKNVTRQVEIVSLLVRLWVEIHMLSDMFRRHLTSASLWGCELKYSNKCCIPGQIVSASLWGCELKFETEAKFVKAGKSQPPCETVSWKDDYDDENGYDDEVILFERMRVEMLPRSAWRRNRSCQPHYEAVNWKEEYGVIVVAARKLTIILHREDCEINHFHI